MVDESSRNNPWGEVEERFSKMEGKVVDISCNMSLLMESLKNKFGPLGTVGDSNKQVWTFGEVGGSNTKFGLDEKSRDNEDPEKESKKEPKKEKPRSSVINSSHCLFKMEPKVDFKPYQGNIDVVKLNH
jgi:hypothetical protein